MTEAPTYRNQFIDLQSKSVDWFLFDSNLCHERVNSFLSNVLKYFNKICSQNVAFAIESIEINVNIGTWGRFNLKNSD